MDQSGVKKEQDNWPNVSKGLEGLSYKTDENHLVTVLLLSQAAHTPLQVCVSA